MWTEAKLDDLLTVPSKQLVQDIQQLKGDIMILGAGGKMGPSLTLLAKKACVEAGIKKRVIAVSRFSDDGIVQQLTNQGVEVIRGDLLDFEFVNALPKVQNIIYIAGRKFGTSGATHLTWASNAIIPALVIDAFKACNIVVFSTGNVYPLVPYNSGGATEETTPLPMGEYAMSCLARERIFEYASEAYGTKVLLYRLNYAVDLRYGILHDIAMKVMTGQKISLQMGYFNCIWQGNANEWALRALNLCTSPTTKLNVTGMETLSVRDVATALGKRFDKPVIFEGKEQNTALLSNAQKAVALFGKASVNMETLIKWQVEWLVSGGSSFGKPTHFEERQGSY